jgi:cysteine-rich repeat protein
LRTILPVMSCLIGSTLVGCPGGAASPDDEGSPDAEAPDDAVEAELPDIVELPPVCGDGRVDSGEECDDGNRMNGDGCDWECRSGDGSFRYPPPDPTIPPIEPTTPPTPATGDEEMAFWAAASGPGGSCHGIWLRAGGGRFALVYNYSQPYFGVRLRVLDRTGATVGWPWSRETPWHLLGHGLAWDGAAFVLFSGHPDDGLYLSRFDTIGTVLDDFLHVRDTDAALGYPADTHWELTDATAAEQYLAVGEVYVAFGTGRWGLETYRPDGTALAAAQIAAPGGVEACVQSGSTADGNFAVTDGASLAVVAPDLRVVGWSGLLDDNWLPAALGIGPDTLWMVLERTEPSSTSPLLATLWVVAMDLDGSLRFPPRQVAGPFSRPWSDSGTVPDGGYAPAAIASGPAGAAVAWFEGRGEALPDGIVNLLTVDAWGNVISPAQSVLGDGVVTPLGWVLDVAADEAGYAVITATEGSVLGTAMLVFRHYAAVP